MCAIEPYISLLKFRKIKSEVWKDVCMSYALKGASTDMRYFGRGKFFRSYVHKKNFRLI